MVSAATLPDVTDFSKLGPVPILDKMCALTSDCSRYIKFELIPNIGLAMSHPSRQSHIFVYVYESINMGGRAIQLRMNL